MVSIVGPDHGISRKRSSGISGFVKRSANWFSVLTAIKVTSFLYTFLKVVVCVVQILLQGCIMGTLTISNAPLLSSEALQ